MFHLEIIANTQVNIKSTPGCQHLTFSTICPHWPSEMRSDDKQRRGLKKGKGAKPLFLDKFNWDSMVQNNPAVNQHRNANSLEHPTKPKDRT